MTIIRKIEISNFRGIQNLKWAPSPGINCLIGPGDSGKTSILDAIGLCLGARRSVAISDMDFYNMDVSREISISITVGDLPDELKSIDSYGAFLRSINLTTGVIDDEPHHGSETVLTVAFRVGADLEPAWGLYSDRAISSGISRDIPWKHRQLLAPAKIGADSTAHLSWVRGSVLNRLSDPPPSLGLELARAAREARALFGREAANEFEGPLASVAGVAAELGIALDGPPRALLDAHAVSIGDGAVSLHSDSGIPLRTLGTGSTRLLVSGLQRLVSSAASIVMLDEVEHGLEPHRLIRLIGSLGAKNADPTLQVFMTTHSPVAIRELAANQLHIVRKASTSHHVVSLGNGADSQGLLRSYPEAFLAKKIVVCEGASEVGFIRGLDEHFQRLGRPSIYACGVYYIDSGGGTPDKALEKGIWLRQLGYDACVFIDNDVPASERLLGAFNQAGGRVFTWPEGYALEDAIFRSMNDAAIESLIQIAISITEEGRIDEHIKSKSKGVHSLDSIFAEALLTGYSESSKVLLGSASRSKNGSWFKSVGKMERIARDVVGPNLEGADKRFSGVIGDLFGWAHG